MLQCPRNRPQWRISGLTEYPDAMALMRDRGSPPSGPGDAGELVWLVEHPPLYTAGTSAKPAGPDRPSRFPTFDAGRGGQWTYHGPGQRVVYVDAGPERAARRVPARDIRCYVNGLEEWLIARSPLRREGRDARRAASASGSRAAGGEPKIGAIGVRVSRWVSWHGVALNVESGPVAFRRHRALRHRASTASPAWRSWASYLQGYRRVLLRGARYPTLRRAPGKSVSGVMLRVNADMLVRLQNYESVRYRQINVRLQTPSGPHRARCFFGDAPTLVEWTPDEKIMTLRSRSF
jgi:lipoyl(octanoyl) transferase